VSGRRSRRQRNGDTSNGEEEREQQDNTRMEGEESSGQEEQEEEGVEQEEEREEQEEEQEEESEGEAQDQGGSDDDRSPNSRKRHHNAGRTPAPEHGSPGEPWSSFGGFHNTSRTPAPKRESPGGNERVPVVNYRLEIQGPRGDISLTCNCKKQHLKICKRDTLCRCRWAKRFHTIQCNEEYANAVAASQHDTSEDEDEEPDDLYQITQGTIRTSPQAHKQPPPNKGPTKNNKRTREGVTGAMPTRHEQEIGGGTAATTQSSDNIGAIVGILQGTVNELKADRMRMTSARNKNKYKDVANKIQQVTPANEKDLKVVAQLYHKAEGEGQILADDDYSKIVDMKGSNDITRHQAEFLKKQTMKHQSIDTHRQIAKEYMANKFSASAVGVAIRSWYADSPPGTTASEAFVQATDAKNLAEWLTDINLQGARDYQEHTHAETWLGQFPKLAQHLNLQMNQKYGKGQWTIRGLEDILKDHYQWESHTKGSPVHPQRRLAAITVDPNNTENKVLRQLMTNRDEELAKQLEEQKNMKDVIDELLAENKRIREQQSTTVTTSPMPALQQHVTSTSGAATADGTTDAMEQGNPRRRSHYEYRDTYRDDEERRGDSRADGRQRRNQRSEDYEYDVRDRRESQYNRDSGKRDEYRSRPISQAPTDSRKGGKSSRGHQEATNRNRGNGIPCSRHFRYGNCFDGRCIRSHSPEDKDECIKYRTNNACNDVACRFKHTPFKGQPARTIMTKAPEQKQLQLLPPQNLVQLGLPYYPQFNNDPGPPEGSPNNAMLPPAPPTITAGNCIFFSKGTCKRNNCRLKHEL
jgi:hypothetical protein